MEVRLLQLHFQKAQRLALGLFQASSTIIPEEFSQPIIEDVTTDLAEFAFHARRVLQIAEIDVSSVEGTAAQRFKYDISSLEQPVETHFARALNRLVHPRTYTVGHIGWSGDKVFLASSNNIIISFARTTTNDPKYEDRNVSILGVSFTFLTGIKALMKERYAEHGF